MSTRFALAITVTLQQGAVSTAVVMCLSSVQHCSYVFQPHQALCFIVCHPRLTTNGPQIHCDNLSLWVTVVASKTWLVGFAVVYCDNCASSPYFPLFKYPIPLEDYLGMQIGMKSNVWFEIVKVSLGSTFSILYQHYPSQRAGWEKS